MKKIYLLLIVLFGMFCFLGCKKEKTPTPEVPSEKTTPVVEPSENLDSIDLAFVNNLLDNINDVFKVYELNYTVTKGDKLVYSNNTKTARTSSDFSVSSITKILVELDVEASTEYQETKTDSNKSLDSKIVDLHFEENYFDNLDSFLKGEVTTLTKTGCVILTGFEYEVAKIQLALNENKQITSITIDLLQDGYHYLYVSSFTY